VAPVPAVGEDAHAATAAGGEESFGEASMSDLKRLQSLLGTGAQEPAQPGAPEPIEWAEFLATVPPTERRLVAHSRVQSKTAPGQNVLAAPPLRLFCDSPTCGVDLYFNGMISRSANADKFCDEFLIYRCRNCGESFKTYAVSVIPAEGGNLLAWAYKYGEDPPFGRRVPDDVLALFGEDRDLFLKGKQAENQGLGLGAFAYYRQVVEAHRTKIYDEVIRVAEALEAGEEAIAALRSARDSREFSASAEQLRRAMPAQLLISGHDPLTLLHDALSDGLHNQNDAACLERATAIRRVLIAFTEKVRGALADNKELAASLKFLLAQQRERRS
jgi:hypothetical protein